MATLFALVRALTAVLMAGLPLLRVMAQDASDARQDKLQGELEAALASSDPVRIAAAVDRWDRLLSAAGVGGVGDQRDTALAEWQPRGDSGLAGAKDPARTGFTGPAGRGPPPPMP